MDTRAKLFTAFGTLILIAVLGLYLAWVIVENKRDWFNRPRRPTRFIALGLAGLGALSVLLHLFGFRLHEIFWWSTPFVAFVSSFSLGAAKPDAGINTAYRFMTVAAPASILAGPFFLFLLAGQAGGCLLGFRIGEAVHRLSCWIRKQTNSPNQASDATSEPAPGAASSSHQG